MKLVIFLALASVLLIATVFLILNRYEWVDNLERKHNDNPFIGLIYKVVICVCLFAGLMLLEHADMPAVVYVITIMIALTLALLIHDNFQKRKSNYRIYQEEIISIEYIIICELIMYSISVTIIQLIPAFFRTVLGSIGL